jgi:hypothetical protein
MAAPNKIKTHSDFGARPKNGFAQYINRSKSLKAQKDKGSRRGKNGN